MPNSLFTEPNCKHNKAWNTCSKCSSSNKSPASQLASIRWAKEKPDPEYFKRISKLAAIARKNKLTKNKPAVTNKELKEVT